MWWLRRPDRQDRGAVAVVVALCMVLLLGFSALAIDIGSIYSDRQQLQNGADAAALAIAESCQRDLTTCTQTMADATGAKYAKANKLDGAVTANVVLDATHGNVQVTVNTIHTNYFAGVLGMPTSAVTAQAKAQFGYPSGGPTVPLTVSWCQFKLATGGWTDGGVPLPGTPITIPLKDQTCTTPATNYVAGGFGWLQGTNCSTNVTSGGWVYSDTGINGANSCANFDWTTILTKPIQIGIFEDYQGSGNNAKYQIKGIATINISAYCFGPDAQYPSNLSGCPSTRRFVGTFVSYVALSNFTIDGGATNFGTGVAALSA